MQTSFENRGKRQGARDKGRRAGAESRSGVSPLSERSAVRLARESRHRRSNIHPPFSSLVVFVEHGDSSEYKTGAENIRFAFRDKLLLPMDVLIARDCVKFRDAIKQKTSVTTANKKLKILRVILGDACKLGLLARNVAKDCPMFTRTESVRRALSQDEIAAILKHTQGTA